MQLSPTLLPVPGGARDQQMGHGREVGHEGVAVDRLARGPRVSRARGLAEGVRLEHLAQVDDVPHLVRDLDAHVALAAHAVDADRLGLEGQGQVVGQADDLRVLDAGVGLELVGGDHRPGVDLLHRAQHAELAALGLEDPALLVQPLVVDADGRLGLVEDGEGRQARGSRGLGGGGAGLSAGRKAAAALRSRPRPPGSPGMAAASGPGRLAASAASGRSSSSSSSVSASRTALTRRTRGMPSAGSAGSFWVCLRMTSRRIFSLRRLSR